MNFVFLMDPLSTVVYEKDTTLALMWGAQDRYHNVFYVGDGNISLQNGKVYFQATSLMTQRVAESPIIKKKVMELPADDVDAVFVRNDPPFDSQYLMNTWLLDQLHPKVAVINSPRGLRTVNEKIWLNRFPNLIPRTLISRRKPDMLSFLMAEKKIIVKPTNAYGGASIFLIEQGDKNTNVILETLTQAWTQDIIAQQYIPQAQQGDKRILLLNGEVLGAVLRVHAPDDHRNNFFAGGKPQACDVSRRDKEIIDTLKPHLKELGLYFVGIDVIGEYLTEVNVTSPTCLQEMNRLYDQKLELKVIEFAEKLIEERRSGLKQTIEKHV